MESTVEQVKKRTSESLSDFGEADFSYITNDLLKIRASNPFIEKGEKAPTFIYGHWIVDGTEGGQPCWNFYSDNSGQAGCQEDKWWYALKSAYTAAPNGGVTCLHNGKVVPMYIFTAK